MQILIKQGDIMEAKDFLSKCKPIIIIILLFSLAFFLRAQAYYLPGISEPVQPFFQDDKGLPYFSEMDSYYNYRLTQDYIDHGYLGDQVLKNGTNWDLHSYYPPGRAVDYPPLIVYFTAFAYKFINLFAQVPLNVICYWMPAFVGSLCVIPAYLFISRITNDYGGITAGILVGTAPFYFSHTFAGFFDTDMFNMLLPLMVLWLFVESVRAEKIHWRTVLVILSALFLLLFSMAWVGWWYLFYLIVGSVILYLLVSIYIPKIDVLEPLNKYPSKIKWFISQKELFSLVVFAFTSTLVLGLYLGFPKFLNSLTEPLGFIKLQELVQTTSYPNVYVSVSELQIPGPWEVAGYVGGIVVLVLGILGVFTLIWNLREKKEKEAGEESEDKVKVKERKTKRTGGRRGKRRRSKREQTKKESTKDIKETKIIKIDEKEIKKNYLFYAILFSIWLLITAYSMTKGVRFALTFSLPVALGAGIFMGLNIENFKTYFNKHLNREFAAIVAFILTAITAYIFFGESWLILIAGGIIVGLGVRSIKTSKYRNMLIIVLLIAAIVSPSVSNAYYYPAGPGTNDSMWNSLTWIKSNTPKNTVLTSWWDFGHLFASTADRPVTFDGGTQNTPRAYWVGRALVTNNESLSAGIIRMLTSSGDTAYMTLDNYTKDTSKSVEILNNILGVDKETALSIMTTKYNLSQVQAQNITKYTHPDDPVPFLFITSGDMVGKVYWWSYFGNWNFTKNKTQPYYYSASPGFLENVNNTTVIYSQNGIIIYQNETNVTAAMINVEAIQSGKVNASDITLDKILADIQKEKSDLIIKPHKFVIMQGNETLKNEMVSNNSSISIFLIIDNGAYRSIVMNKELEDSMFTRMFFMRGVDLKIFKLVYESPETAIKLPENVSPENVIQLEYQLNFENKVMVWKGS